VLGASADRPAALAEAMGIIVNGGVRKPIQRIDSLHFAKGTPYETLVKHAKAEKFEQVISPEVARVVADAIRGVVSDGTAKRVKSAFVAADGSIIAVGGKTGTGDQRFDVYGAGGRLIESRFVNRSATFVFNNGERFFGSMTAYVHGPDAAHYDFTSALPVQLLVALAPTLMPMIDPEAAAKQKAAAAAAAAAPPVVAAAKVEGAAAKVEEVAKKPAVEKAPTVVEAKPKADKPVAAKSADAAVAKPKAEKPVAAKSPDDAVAKPKAAATDKPKPVTKAPKPEVIPQRPQELF
jgi:membrane peptidoglycan carboxypeptidase